MNSIDPFGMVWAAQLGKVALGTGIFGAFAAVFVGGIAYLGNQNEHNDTEARDLSYRVFLVACFVALVCVAIAIAGAIVPTKETIIYSGAIQYGPEYADRILSILEAK